MWFYENLIVLNSKKYHYVIIPRNIANKSITLDNMTLHTKAEQQLFGVTTDRILNFQSHTKSIIKIANQKLNALIRVTPFMTNSNKVIFAPLLKGSWIFALYSGCLT